MFPFNSDAFDFNPEKSDIEPLWGLFLGLINLLPHVILGDPKSKIRVNSAPPASWHQHFEMFAGISFSQSFFTSTLQFRQCLQSI
jgi:hypothetical protein